eukprot:CAMPEP_0198155298 /NCGR_PEP_ID=MMETSP1443-20131203/69064_1 /TAXON_ID=186043 /ORGANISM="Entomoneis sp., Strain CCMP2396" /LENGTH=608 /DNA_ID=CAMNT_0043822045 /DNA_START=84 /DNA_END=1910 /DNA_ORIENTATION=-
MLSSRISPSLRRRSYYTCNKWQRHAAEQHRRGLQLQQKCLQQQQFKQQCKQQSQYAFFSTTSTSSSSSSNNTNFQIKWWHPVIGGLVITVAGGVKWLHDHLGGTEGFQRSASFYSKAIPRYLMYRYHMVMDSPNEVWEELDKETSKIALEKMLELEGFYYKAGQMCASNLGDAFPQIWRDTMSVLQDQVPPQPFDVVKKTIESEMDFEKTFKWFEEKPIGSASIGQVHRAELWNGTKVVVKVCYPNAERLLRGDVRTIKTFASLAQPVHVPALAEIEKQFATEFDYRQEAQNMATVRNNLNRAGFAGPGKACQVPRLYMEHCTKRVLVMEELFGDKLQVALKNDVEFHAKRDNQTVQEFLRAQQQKDKNAIEKGQKVQGPTEKEFNVLIAVEDSKRKARNAWNRVYNTTVGWLSGSGMNGYQDKSTLPLNHAKLVDDLIEIHGHEVLVDGFFNGDCHPGNVLLCRDELNESEPQLGLIDYGQVKRLTKEQRHLFAKLIIALDEGNRDLVVKYLTEAGHKSQKMDAEAMYLYAKVAFDNDSREITGGLHIQLFMEKLQEKDPVISIANDFVMVSRCTLLLRGLAHALKQSRTIARAWRPIAERVLQEDI